MWDDRLNEYLDNPSGEVDRELKEQYVRYRYVMGVYAAKISYHPSEKLKEEFLKKLRAKKKLRRFFKYALTAGSIAVVFLAIIQAFPKKSIEVQMNDLLDSIRIVRTVGDGF